MASQRRLLVGMVALVRGRVRGSMPAAARAHDEVEALLGPEFFEKAPFDQVGVILCYGEQTRLQPEYERIVTHHGIKELPIAVELDMNVLRKATPEQLYQIFRQAWVEALLAVAEKYGLRDERLREERRA